jgi:hypothetical protein
VVAQPCFTAFNKRTDWDTGFSHVRARRVAAMQRSTQESEMARHKADVADDEFEIYASYHSAGDGRYIGGLKVVRKADRKILFPFEGAPQIGPYDTVEEARRAAVEYGRALVAADRAAPEA